MKKEIAPFTHTGDVLLPGESAYTLKGLMYGNAYEEKVESIEEAIEVAGYACDSNSWAAQVLIDGKGEVVMTRSELLDAYWQSETDS